MQDSFAVYIDQQSNLSDAQKTSIRTSHTNREVMKYLHATWMIDGVFWGGVSVTGGIMGMHGGYLSISDIGGDDMLMVSLFLSGFRYTVGYSVSRLLHIPRPSQYAGLQTIPFIGRYAPITRLPEHREYLSCYGGYKRERMIGSVRRVSLACLLSFSIVFSDSKKS